MLNPTVYIFQNYCSVSSPQSAGITYRCKLSCSINPWILVFWSNAIITQLLNTWIGFQNSNSSFFQCILSLWAQLYIKSESIFSPFFPYEHIQLSVETVKHISHTIRAKNTHLKNRVPIISVIWFIDHSLVNQTEHRAVHVLLYQHSCRIFFSSLVIKENLSKNWWELFWCCYPWQPKRIRTASLECAHCIQKQTHSICKHTEIPRREKPHRHQFLTANYPSLLDFSAHSEALLTYIYSNHTAWSEHQDTPKMWGNNGEVISRVCIIFCCLITSKKPCCFTSFWRC